MMTITQKLVAHLKAAQHDIKTGERADAINRLKWAMRYAREEYAFPCDIPLNRCRRAYISQAIQAMEQVNANS